MKHNLTLSIPNSTLYLSIALKVIEETAHTEKIPSKEIDNLLKASRELLVNAITHAYPKGRSGIIDIDIHLQPHGIQIDVHDMGIPLDFDRCMQSSSGGLKRIDQYVDELRFSNMGSKGKSFSIFKAYHSRHKEDFFQPYSDLGDDSPAYLKPASIQIRDFEDGDEEYISRLIYNNYTYSYYKALFYYPKKIKELNDKRQIASIIAETKSGKIIGHFAIVKVKDSNSAEIGVAVVHPDYKGKGVMNAMLDRVLTKAKEMHLDAIFGEALMLHPFSQRANLSHGFAESALVLGIVPNTVSLTDPNALHLKKRAAVLVAYKLLKENKERALFIPKKYAKLIKTIYKNNKIEIVQQDNERYDMPEQISYELSAYTQSGTLIIDYAGERSIHTMKHFLHTLYRKHVDMIFADINLSRCSKIDNVISWLANEGFVFSGILFYRRRGDDYLRMQIANSDIIETKKIVCHSSFCHQLLSLINAELEIS